MAQSMGQLGKLDNSDKPEAGKKANEIKQQITALLDSWQVDLNAAEASLPSWPMDWASFPLRPRNSMRSSSSSLNEQAWPLRDSQSWARLSSPSRKDFNSLFTFSSP